MNNKPLKEENDNNENDNNEIDHDDLSWRDTPEWQEILKDMPSHEELKKICRPPSEWEEI